MKKIYLLALISFFSIEAHAATLIDTLGAECARIVYEMQNEKYPDEKYADVNARNSQFGALNKCLTTYKNNGGNIEELNTRYLLAVEVANCHYNACLKEQPNLPANECADNQKSTFQYAVTLSPCDIFSYSKQQNYPCKIDNKEEHCPTESN